MIKYNKINAKLSNLRLSKLKIAVKNNGGLTVRISSKNFNSQYLLHELYLTTRQIAKLRNSFENNMSTDIKLSKSQIKKNYVRWCFGFNFRKISWSIIKNCYTISNKSLTSFEIKWCNGLC